MMKAISDRMRWVTFWAMMSVIYIHCNTLGTLPYEAGWNKWIQELLTRALTSWAVPAFFVMSGFWFERGAKFKVQCSMFKVQCSGAWAWWRMFWGKKIRSLLVPYLLWGLIGCLLFTPLTICNNVMMHRGMFERTIFAVPGLLMKVDQLFGVLTVGGPIWNLALWYVHSLLVLFLLAPIWWALSRAWKPLLWMFAVAGVVMYGRRLSVPYLHLLYDSIGFFTLGMAVARDEISNWRVPLMLGLCAGLSWICLGVARVCGVAHTGCCVLPLSGMIFFWWLSQSCAHGRFVELAKPSFWVYCLHAPVCGWMLAAGLYLTHKQNVWALALTLVLPWVTLGICLFAARCVQKLSPRVYGVLSGGR